MENSIQMFKDSKNTKMALLIRADYSENGIDFLTENDDYMQVAYMGHPAGHIIVPHYHNLVERVVNYTCETLVIRKGTVEVTLYESKKPIHVFKVYAGDVLTLFSGGHGLKMIDNVEMIEIKQGPYVGTNDKTRF